MGSGLRFRKDIARGFTRGGTSEKADAKDVAIRTRRCVHIDMMVTKAVDKTKTTCVKMLSKRGAMKGIVEKESVMSEASRGSSEEMVGRGCRAG
jgi:hypothetical protein